MNLGSMAGVKAQDKGKVTFSILLGSDHNIHLIVEYDRERIDCPLTPAEAMQIASQLMSGSQMVSGFKNQGMVRLPNNLG